jgi:beta-phosphoglucomutase-like phosphatase (HAD superfamily)
MHIQSVFLFDLDGTLVDSVYQHVLAWMEALDGEGVDLSVWRIHRKIGMSGGLFVDQFLRETGLSITPELLTRLRERHAAAYNRTVHMVKPLPGARALLQALDDGGIPWAIATSGRLETAKPNLDALGVDPAKNVPRHGPLRQTRSRPVPDCRRETWRADRELRRGRRFDLGHAGIAALPGSRRRSALRRLWPGRTRALRRRARLRRPVGFAQASR